jgi:hypothetical protein
LIKPTLLHASNIFTGVDDDKASIWVFDGETVHGPVTIGFVHTAVQHGALKSDVYICEQSTVNGWKPLADVKHAPVNPILMPRVA